MNKFITLATIIFTFALNLNVFAQGTAPTTTTTTPAAIPTTAPPAAPGLKGMKIIDPERGVSFEAPNNMWGINAGKYSISLNHKTHYDAHVTLKKSWYSVGTAQEAYTKRKSSLKSYIPGAIYIKDNEPLTIGGNTAAISIIYENPADLNVFREMVFIHKGQAYELVFKAKKENFAKVKEDFGYILKNMKLF